MVEPLADDTLSFVLVGDGQLTVVRVQPSVMSRKRPPTFGELILAARLVPCECCHRPLTQIDVARACGTSQPAVAAWEADQKFPSHGRLFELANVLKLDVTALLEAINRTKAAAAA